MTKNNIDFGSTFDKIVSLENIRLAYFDIARKFDTSSMTNRYRGVDGLILNDLDYVSEKVLREIQTEMKTFKDISPAYLANVPKKSGKKRRIYVYPIKERIKAEAIYRVLWPLFDSFLSDFLFSYRASHPSYYAIRSAIRRYKRNYGKDYVFVTDIKDYTDSIYHDKLLKRIDLLGLDVGTRKLLELFIKVGIHEDGKLVKGDFGLITGTPLTGMLSNYFLDEFDKWAGKHVAFYRRVGDDMIIMDKDVKKVEEVKNILIQTAEDLRLNINEAKSKVITNTETFNFLGYQFCKGLQGFDGASMKKAIAKWKRELFRKNNKSVGVKIKNLKNLNKEKIGSPDYEFGMLIKQKNLVNDTDQIKKFSGSLVGCLAAYLYGRDNSKNRESARAILKENHTRTLFEQYQNMYKDIKTR